jgi:hypothetical protein
MNALDRKSRAGGTQVPMSVLLQELVGQRSGSASRHDPVALARFTWSGSGSFAPLDPPSPNFLQNRSLLSQLPPIPLSYSKAFSFCFFYLPSLSSFIPTYRTPIRLSFPLNNASSNLLTSTQCTLKTKRSDILFETVPSLDMFAYSIRMAYFDQ